MGDDNAIYGIPYRASGVLRIDSKTDSAKIIGPNYGIGNYYWHGGVKCNGKIYGKFFLLLICVYRRCRRLSLRTLILSTPLSPFSFHHHSSSPKSCRDSVGHRYNEGSWPGYHFRIKYPPSSARYKWSKKLQMVGWFNWCWWQYLLSGLWQFGYIENKCNNRSLRDSRICRDG